MNQPTNTEGFRPYLAYGRTVLVASLLATGMLAGCGGNSADTGDAPIAAPVIEPVVEPVVEPVAALTLASSTPTDGATGVARSVAPQMTFSTGLDSATATADNVTLTSVAGSVNASLAVAGTQLTVTPSKPLALLTTYTLEAGTGLTGMNGEKLASAQTLSFKTADGTWGMDQVIGAAVSGNYDPKIAVDGNGNAIAVWYQYDASWNNSSIYANRYVAGTGWGTPQLIETGNGSGYDPQIAIDANGNATAVWYQYDGAYYSIYANRYNVGAGWGTEELIEANSGYAYEPQVAIDASGNSIVTWNLYATDWNSSRVYANRYVAGSGWGSAEVLAGAGGYNTYAYDSQIVMQSNGNAIAVWTYYGENAETVNTRRYVAGTGWATAQRLDTGSNGAYEPRIVMDASGNAIAVWEQYDGSDDRLYASRYVAGTGWATPQRIDASTSGIDDASIAMDGSGNAMVVWEQYDGTNNDQIHANRYTSGTGWGAAQRIDSGSESAYEPQIAVDASGNAIAVWEQYDGNNDRVYASRYVAGTGWSAAKIIDTGSNSADNPAIAIGASGDAIAVWTQYDGSVSNIQANRFD